MHARHVLALVGVVGFAVAGCTAGGSGPSPSSTAPGDPGTPGPSATAAASAPSTGGPSAAPSTPAPTPWPDPSFDDRFVPIDALTFAADGQTVTIGFTGGPPYVPSDPCGTDYRAVIDDQGTALVVGVTQVAGPGPDVGCDAVGHGRELVVRLDAPFTGTEWIDRRGYRHFLEAPAGLVVLPLGREWVLADERDLPESPTGRWSRTWTATTGPEPAPAIELIQAFGGPVLVSGGEPAEPVDVDGSPGTLYRSAGELVLVWRFGESELALVTTERAFTSESLLELASGVTAG